MRNLAAKLPEDIWPEFKVRAQAAYQAPSWAVARELAAGVVADYGRKYDSAVACFMDDFEACIAHLRFPVTHRRAIRITDYEFARTPVRRGTPPPQDHPECVWRASRPEADVRRAHPCRRAWRSIKVTEFEHRQIAAIKKELDQEYEAQVDLKAKTSKDATQVKISSSPRT